MHRARRLDLTPPCQALRGTLGLLAESTAYGPSFRHAQVMFLLSRVTGQAVRDPDSRIVGHVHDLSVRLGNEAGPDLVERLVLRRHRGTHHLIPWSAIDNFEETGVRLRPIGDLSALALDTPTDDINDDEILLARDVLDTQIVDVTGQRLARVADVLLLPRSDGRLELVGVEVGFGAVLRRLGCRRLADRVGNDVVEWRELHLTSDRGHTAQLAAPRSAVHHLDAAGLVGLVSRLDIESATEILSARGSRVAAEVIRSAHPAVSERMLRAMPSVEAATVVAALPNEQATRWRSRLEHSPALLGRRFLRSRVWPHRRHRTAGNNSPNSTVR